MEISQLKKFALPVVCVFLVIFLALIVFARNGLIDLNKKKKELVESVEENKTLDEENKVLYREVNRLKNDQEFIEQVARKDLGMIKKDEIIVKFHSDKDKEDVKQEAKPAPSPSAVPAKGSAGVTEEDIPAASNAPVIDSTGKP